MRSKTRKIVMTALMMACVCAATMIIKVPSPLKGYLNLGDCVVLMAGWMLSPGYGFLAAGVGSALADLFSGYMTYVPATFVIKGLMALIVFVCYKLMSKRLGSLVSQIIGGVIAEAIMVLGYFVFEGFLYGFIPSIVNIPANCVQGAAGLVMGIILIRVYEARRNRA
ncbi:MAG: ECF transporter S component [Clostridia bacterium]|nr:ECF transporter S component [Clostridia bacterium]